MSLALDPNQTVTFTIPTAPELSLTTRHLTVRQRMQYAVLLEEAVKAESQEVETANLCEALKLCQLTPAADTLIDTLTLGELWDVCYGVLHETTLREVDIKKSVSLSRLASQAATAASEAASPAPNATASL